MIQNVIFESEDELISYDKAKREFSQKVWYCFKPNRERVSFSTLDEAVDFAKTQKGVDYGATKAGKIIEDLKLIRQLDKSDYKLAL